MDCEDIKFHDKKKRRCRYIIAIVLVLVLFAVGIIIGYFIGKRNGGREQERSHAGSPGTGASEAARREIRQNLRDFINADKISENSRLVTVNLEYVESKTNRFFDVF